MKTIEKLEEKEPNKEEIQKILKQNLLKLFAQVKKAVKEKFVIIYFVPIISCVKIVGLFFFNFFIL